MAFTGCGGDVAGLGGPASMSAVAGTTPQTATAGSVVATPPAVNVVDANGQAVPGATVTFRVQSGGGAVTGEAPVTNSNGIATVTGWTLGATAGTNTLTATVANLAPVTFTASGVAGVPAQLAKNSADPQSAVVGAAVSAAPSVIVKDGRGNPVAGVAVTFAVTSGAGALTGGSTSTDASGVATLGSWRLGTIAGANTLTAGAAGIQTVSFSATGTPGPAASVITTPPSPITLAVGGTQQLTSVVTDQYGNVIASPSLSFSSNNNSIATVSSSGLITGVSSGSTLLTIAGAGNSKQLTVVVGGHPTGASKTIIASIPGRPFGIRVSSANVLAVTQQDPNTTTFLDASGAGTRTLVAVGSDPGDVIFNRAGTTAYVSGYNDGSVQRVNVASGVAAGFVSVGGNAYRLVLSPDETQFYLTSTNGAGTLFVVALAGPSVVTGAALGSAPQGLALSADGQVLYVSTRSGRVGRYSTATLVSTATNDVGGIPQDVALSMDGSELFVANENGWVDVLDATTLASKQRIPTAGLLPFGLAVTTDGTQVYVSSSATGHVIVIDRATRTVVRTIFVSGTPRRIAFTTDGLTALVANEGGWVDVLK